eukprot:4583084-Lingulodinium_polyedra.AAC.1
MACVDAAGVRFAWTQCAAQFVYVGDMAIRRACGDRAPCVRSSQTEYIRICPARAFACVCRRCVLAQPMSRAP